MVHQRDGDRVLEDHGEETVVTPLNVSNAHNFGPASVRDNIVSTCGRPGGDTKGQSISTREKVDEWFSYMTTPKRKIKHVFILLTDGELKAYEEPGLIQAYEECGIVVHHIPYASENSFEKIMADLDEIEKKGENAVAHCTHGMGRSGRVAAGWLVHKYGISIEQAVDEALDAARRYGVERMGAPRQLSEWMA